MLENILGELQYLVSILLSVVLGFAIGYERKLRFKEAGIRTHTIVCAGSALIMVVSKYGFGDSIEADASRVAAQIVSGIGFLGAGTIISTQASRVRGLTTAAGLWAAACIGLAIGIGFFEAAIGATVVVMLTIVVFQRVDHFFYTRSPILRVYLEMESIDYVKGLIRTIRSNGMRVSGMELQKPKSGMQNAVGIALVVKKNTRRNPVDMLDVISRTEGLTFIEETL